MIQLLLSISLLSLCLEAQNFKLYNLKYDSLFITQQFEVLSDLIDDELVENPEPLELQNFYAWKSKIAKERQDFEQMQFYTEKALTISRNHNTSVDPILYGDVLYINSVVKYRLGEVDSALYYAKLSLKHHQENSKINTNNITQPLRAIGIYFNHSGKFKEALKYQYEALKNEFRQTPLNYNSIVATIYSIANTLTSENNYIASINYCNKALSYYDNNQASLNAYKAHIYNTLGVNYGFLNDNETAIEYYKEALRLFKKYTPKNKAILATIKNNIATYKMSIGMYDEARVLLTEAVHMLKTAGLRRELYWKYYSLGVNENESGNFKKGLKHLTFSLNEILAIYGRHNELSVLILNESAKSYIGLKQYDKAEDFLNQAIDIAKKMFGEKDQDLAQCYFTQAKIHYLLDRHRDCIKTTELIEETLRISKRKNNNQKDTYISIPLLIETYYLKNKALLALYEKTKHLTHLTNSLHTAKKSLDYSNEFINFYYHQSSIHSFFLLNDKTLKQGIDICKALYDATGDVKFIYQAHIFFEVEKSYLLNREVQDAYAKLNSNVPDSLIWEEIQLKKNISHLQKQLYVAPQENSNQKIEIEQKLFSTNNRLKSLLFEIESKYPNYFELKYTLQKPNLIQVQQNLDPNTCLIEYFKHQNNIYSINITRDTITLNHDTIPNLSEKISRYIESIANSDIEAYTSLANKFFKFLLKPDILKTNITSLIIIPSKDLSLLSFGSFTSSYQKNTPYKDLDYLIKDYAILYQNNANKIQKPISKAHKGYLGISPTFKSSNYATLDGANKEIENIRAKLKGDILLGDEATKKNLLETCQDYKILHFGTHAETNISNASYSKLFLNSHTHHDSIEAYFLYEIQNSITNANLVVLSACNTNTGKIYAGEGVASLARSFLYAGAQSTLTSLWDIPDFSTSQIVTSFFEYLDVKNKSAALQEAKLNYLNKADEHLSNPKYWAGLVITGDDSSIKLDTYRGTWIYVIGFLLILIMFLLNCLQ